ncbi:uncharacterized protein THITE_2111514 [Thermothielavioides terrestris NRRL 8126]|uniref:RING-type E3 ubiquitin transferase n=1 Tax=Thermothielavioides terrestris (strain ATCC 38088 / NRRL 8126) TaxID=578455 RepID=G2R2Q7_THETT|nr:uncharacterized protein THITE_2111514 [Thermothielavioides terrestris NRRL 8126]AEO65018.1 hypothetical protein THITE_2111514 [Thermothielavioides terrestris NRRL 8126]
MRPPRVAILVLFCSASLFLIYRSVSSFGRPRPAAQPLAAQKSSLRAFFSFSAPFSLFPPNAAISLTDDNSTFFPARPAAFGPPLPASGLSGQLWIGSGFSEESLQDGDGEGELGCSDIPGWEDGRSQPALQVAERGSISNKRAHGAADGRSPKADLGMDPVVDRDAVEEPSERESKPVNDGTDDYLHQQTRSTRSEGTTTSASSHADIQSIQESAEITGKIVLLSRGGCGFLEKVKWAQRRGAIAVIVGDNQKGGPLIQMFARGNVDNVTIPSVFTSRTTAHLLSSLTQPGSFIEDTLDEHGKPKLSVQRSVKGGKDQRSRDRVLSAKAASRTSALASPAQQSPPPEIARSTRVRRSWISRIFRWSGDQGTSSDWGRTRSSAGSDRVLVDNPDNNLDKPTKNSLGKTAEGEAQDGGSHIETRNWRNSDLPGRTAKRNEDSTTRKSINGDAQLFHSAPSARQVGKAGRGPSADIDRPEGGINAPRSGRYKASAVENAATHSPGTSGSSYPRGRGLFPRIFGGEDDSKHKQDQMSDKSQSPPATNPVPVPPSAGGNEAREGLWVTITPTGSASPFFDTLLVLVISPLITLTVVYALLILRVKIRMRRWRAPKSVIEQLPVRTYHAVAPSPTQSPRTPSPASSSPTTPLLQGSSRSRPRSRTTTDVPEAAALLGPDGVSPTARTRSREKKKPSGTSSQWRKYMGRQVECVVCLEEYVDGVSRVMRLPCGHEFHAECITPWLTTRRRTCPICKSDVVRSLARHSSPGPQYEPFREDSYDSSGESSDTYQNRLPSPNRVDDLERGPTWTQASRQEWQPARHDVWFSALTSRWAGNSSFSREREASGEDGDRR